MQRPCDIVFPSCFPHFRRPGGRRAGALNPGELLEGAGLTWSACGQGNALQGDDTDLRPGCCWCAHVPGGNQGVRLEEIGAGAAGGMS